MAEERTFIMAKPNALERGLVGEIISRFERKDLRLERLQKLQVSKEMAARLYEEHEGKPFYDDLVTFITSGPVVAMEWVGADAVRVGRMLMGATDPAGAAPGSIRGDFGLEIGANIVHGSDSHESARRELAIFFP